MKVTVGIKALNEEEHIASSLASAVDAVEPFQGQVILADSGSTDGTIELAQKWPVRIVQFANASERCCGSAAQLAFQYVESEYFYMLDGDMVLQPGFIDAAVDFLDHNPEFAGVGGAVQERNIEALEFQVRALAVKRDNRWLSGTVDRLDCGGLYRTAAIRDVGFFADRNLHAFEEFELAARLASRGWRLARLSHPAVDHYGHQTGGYWLLWRRFITGYAGGPGEVLRGALGQPHLYVVLQRLLHIRYSLIVISWWFVMIAGAFWSIIGVAMLLFAPIAFLSARRGSLTLGLYSFVSWNVAAIAFIGGFMRRRISPYTPINAVERPSAIRR